MDRGTTAASRFSVETVSMKREPEEPQEVESSPNGRYVRVSSAARHTCNAMWAIFFQSFSSFRPAAPRFAA